MAELAGHPAIDEARRLIRETDAVTLADQEAVVSVPAPTSQESARADWMRDRLRQIGMPHVDIDEVGNVIAELEPGASREAGAVLLVAHLDTIFPEETEVRIRRQSDRILAPGISDNGRGLAAGLCIARVLLDAEVRPARPVVVAATVGEEGLGDLRGVKHLFRSSSPFRQAAGFIALDGSGLRRIVHRAVGSRRLRAVVRGPGGHSWADWGLANPIDALGIAVARMAALRLAKRPRTSLTAGRIQGGTSVNAIPAEAWLELDLRSEGAGALADLESRVRDMLHRGHAEANRKRRRGTRPLDLAVDIIGDRPAGETPAHAHIVRAACAATRQLGEEPELVASSTDANVPISLGIPAIALGAGGESGGMHTLGEWYANTRGPDGIERVLLTLLGFTGLR